MSNEANVKRLADMRNFAEEVSGMSEFGKRTLAGAIKQIEDHWSTQLKEAYGSATSTRDEAREGVVEEAKRLQKEASQEVAEAVKAGRLSAKDARAWLRNSEATHDRTMQQHKEILDRETDVSTFAKMTPDEYQELIFSRHPQLEERAPSLDKAMREYAEAHPPPSKTPRRRVAPGAIDPDDFERELRNPGEHKTTRRGSQFQM